MSFAPEWFFSTLAQSIAALVGFNIALLTSIYVVKFTRSQNRNQDFLREIKSFKENNFEHLEKLEKALEKKLDLEESDIRGINDITFTFVGNINLADKILKSHLNIGRETLIKEIEVEDITEISKDYEKEKTIYLLLLISVLKESINRISKYTTKLQDKKIYLNQIIEFDEKIRSFFKSKSSVKKLYDENSDDEDEDLDYTEGTIFSSDDSDIRTIPRFKEKLFKILDNLEDILDYSSGSLILQSFERERNLIKLNFFLFLLGVFLPIVFLQKNPIIHPIVIKNLWLIQPILLGVIVFLVTWIFYSMISLIHFNKKDLNLFEKVLGEKISENYFPEVYELFKKENLEPPRVKLKDNKETAGNSYLWIRIGEELINKLSTDELFAALLHEQGHTKNNFHQFIWMLSLILSIFGVFFVLLSIFLYQNIQLLIIGLSFRGFFPYPFQFFKIKSEFLADQYSIKYLNNPKNLVNALKKLRELGGEGYHFLLDFTLKIFLFPFDETHPSMEERINKISELKEDTTKNKNE